MDTTVRSGLVTAWRFATWPTMGIPEFRLEKKVVNAEIDILKEMGVEFKTGVEIGRDVTIPELRKQGYEAFYLGIGASKGTPVGCKGDDLEGVWTGLDFLRDVNTGKEPEVGGQVAVVGGGNVAMETTSILPSHRMIYPHFDFLAKFRPNK